MTIKLLSLLLSVFVCMCVLKTEEKKLKKIGQNLKFEFKHFKPQKIENVFFQNLLST